MGQRTFNQDLCDWTTQYKSANKNTKEVASAASVKNANEFKAAGGRRGRRRKAKRNGDNNDGDKNYKKNDPSFTSN